MFKFLILIFICFTPLFAEYEDLNESEKKELLGWFNQHCQDHHETFLSFEHDYYFICDRKAMSEANFINNKHGIIAFTDNYAFGLSEHKFRAFSFYLIVYFIFPLLGLLAYYFITNKLWPKKYIVIIFFVPVYFSLKILLYPYSMDVLLNGNMEQFKTFLPIYNFTNNMNQRRESALGLAIQSGDIEKVKYLIEERDYNPNESIYADDISKHNELPYEVALNYHVYEVAYYLKHFLPANYVPSIDMAVKSKDQSLLIKSFQLTKPTNEAILEAFIIAIEYKNNKAIEYLFEKNANLINQTSKQCNCKPLEYAIKVDNYEAVKFLVEHNATINECGMLARTADTDNAQVLEYLMDHGGNIFLECENDYDSLFLQMKNYRLTKNAFLKLDENTTTKVEELLIRKNLMPSKDDELFKRKQTNFGVGWRF